MNMSPKKGGFNGKKEKQSASPVRIWARPRFCLIKKSRKLSIIKEWAIQDLNL
jgi:hypothetical protein